MLTLLLTRPRAHSQSFAAALEAAVPGRFRIVMSPLQEIELRRQPIDVRGITALAFTSAHGVAAFAAACAERSLPAYCVGAQTAQAARSAGLTAVSADGTASDLADLVARETSGPVLHIRGLHVAARLAPLLMGRVPVREHVGYEQRSVPPEPAAAQMGALGRIDVAAVFSSRSAKLLCEASANWTWSRTTVVSISAAADAPLAVLRPMRRLIAREPSRSGMLAALRDL